MPDWDEINKRLKEEEKSLSEPTELPSDTDPRNEDWSARTDTLQREREAEEKTRRNEPGMLKVGFKFTFDKIAGWLKKLKLKK